MGRTYHMVSEKKKNKKTKDTTLIPFCEVAFITKRIIWFSGFKALQTLWQLSFSSRMCIQRWELLHLSYLESKETRHHEQMCLENWWWVSYLPRKMWKKQLTGFYTRLEILIFQCTCECWWASMLKHKSIFVFSSWLTNLPFHDFLQIC